jgi:hypothetical protein
MQRTVQHQSLDFVHRPDHRLNRVPSQLLESRDALVTVNDQIAIRLIRNSDDDDRCLLSRGRQRRQQLPLPLWIPRPQMFMAAVQLVKLQLHFRWSPAVGILQQAQSGIAPMQGEVCRQALVNQRDTPGTAIARSAAGVCP